MTMAAAAVGLVSIPPSVSAVAYMAKSGFRPLSAALTLLLLTPFALLALQVLRPRSVLAAMGATPLSTFLAAVLCLAALLTQSTERRFAVWTWFPLLVGPLIAILAAGFLRLHIWLPLWL
jgi:hypothetical protein